MATRGGAVDGDVVRQVACRYAPLFREGAQGPIVLEMLTASVVAGALTRSWPVFVIVLSVLMLTAIGTRRLTPALVALCTMLGASWGVAALLVAVGNAVSSIVSLPVAVGIAAVGVVAHFRAIEWRPIAAPTRRA